MTLLTDAQIESLAAPDEWRVFSRMGERYKELERKKLSEKYASQLAAPPPEPAPAPVEVAPASGCDIEARIAALKIVDALTSRLYVELDNGDPRRVERKVELLPKHPDKAEQIVGAQTDAELDAIVAPRKEKAPADLPIVVTVTPDVRKPDEMVRKPGTWAQLVTSLENPKEHAKKEAMPLFKLARFGDVKNEKGSLRHNGNVEQIFGLVADYDAEKVSVKEAAAMLELEGVESVIYATPSHLTVTEKSRGGPRWRVVAPLSKPHAPGEYAALTDRLNGALCGVLASESWTLSQVFYYGRVGGVPYEVYHVRGKPIDLIEGIPSLGKRTEAPAKSKATSRSADLASFNAQRMAELESATVHYAKGGAAWDYGMWVKEIGLPLASLKDTPFEERARLLWHQVSALSKEQYDEAQAEDKWSSFEPNDITYKTLFKRAIDAGWSKDDDYHTKVDHTDTGNANLLESLTEGNVRYVPELKLWIVWTGERWERDEHGAHVRAQARRVAKHYAEKAAAFEKQAKDSSLPDGDRDRLQKVAKSVRLWEKQCRDRNRLDSMLSEFSKRPSVVLSVTTLDRDLWLLGVQNGVVDLRTGALRPAAREDFVTKRCSVPYVPGAVAPRWVQFIDEITGDPVPPDHDSKTGEVNRSTVGRYTRRKALAHYIQLALGYGITGITREQKMFLAIGDGSNGKNVLLDLLQGMLGEYVVAVPPEMLMASKFAKDAERPTAVAASLAGARLAVTSESKAGQNFDTEIVKRLTGDEKMTARRMRENPFTFVVTHKLWLLTNARPGMEEVSPAMRGRLHLIPFDRRWNRPGHPEHDASLPDGDPKLLEQLRGEAEGVLAWLVAGAVAYNREGLPPPPEVIAATRAYFKEQDAVAGWLDGYGRCPPADGAGAQALHMAFESWCAANGRRSLSAVRFSAALKQARIEWKDTSTGRRYGLRPNAEGALV